MSKDWNIGDPPVLDSISGFHMHESTPEQLVAESKPWEISADITLLGRTFHDDTVMTLKVFRYWEWLFGVTLEQGGSYHEGIEIRTGISTTDEQRNSFAKSIGAEVSAGVDIKAVSIGAKINTTFTWTDETAHSVTLTEETIKARDFSATSDSHASIEWWQLIEKYTLNTVVYKSGQANVYSVQSITHRSPLTHMTRYPS